MKKLGKVINFDDEKVYIITKHKEFVTLERNKTVPIKGQEYEGIEYVDKSNLIKVLLVIIVAALIIIGGIYYTFFSPRASIIVTMHDNLNLGINRNKIIELSDVNGLDISNENFPSIKGDNLDEGLTLLFDYYTKSELLPPCDEYSPGEIYIYITKSHKKEPLQVESFSNYASEHNYNVIINRNDNVLNISK